MSCLPRTALLTVALACAAAPCAPPPDRATPTTPAEPSPLRKNRAYVVSIRGDVRVQRVAETRWRPATIPIVLVEGDFIRTGKHSYATLRDAQGTMYQLRPETVFEVPSRGSGPRFRH